MLLGFLKFRRYQRWPSRSSSQEELMIGR
jgi:hypothetical protein